VSAAARPVPSVASRELMRSTLASFETSVSSVSDAFGLVRLDTPEMPRYVMTLDALRDHSAARPRPELPALCDLGGYFGILAAAAGELGYSVAVVDSYEGLTADPRTHDDLHGWWKARSIATYDCDLQDPDLRLPFADASFDAITLLAVIEHFPHTPRLVLEEARRVLRPDGLLIVDTPNAGALGTRVGFLLHGEGLWEPIDRFYYGPIPFAGHSRCYSRRELRSILTWSGFTVDEFRLFDLDPPTGSSALGRLFYGVLCRSVLRRRDDLRGYLWAVARPTREPGVLSEGARET